MATKMVDLSSEQLDKILDPAQMVVPGAGGGGE